MDTSGVTSRRIITSCARVLPVPDVRELMLFHQRGFQSSQNDGPTNLPARWNRLTTSFWSPLNAVSNHGKSASSPLLILIRLRGPMAQQRPRLYPLLSLLCLAHKRIIICKLRDPIVHILSTVRWPRRPFSVTEPYLLWPECDAYDSQSR